MDAEKFLKTTGVSLISIGVGLILAACAAEGKPPVASPTATTVAQPEMASEAEKTGDGDAARGKTLFEDQCSGCHSLSQNRVGPKLGKVVGWSIASVPGFEYSPALKKLHGAWSEALLERWLADPQEMAKGNRMGFQVKVPADRRDLIAFLKSVS